MKRHFVEESIAAYFNNLTLIQHAMGDGGEGVEGVEGVDGGMGK
ncbi:MAG: hypothetical protein WBA39_29665 [Rivularia sp. (in: cyanobacteria)]